MNRWLTQEEEQAWGPFVLASLNLMSTLDRELKAAFNLSHLDYGILDLLSRNPRHVLRMSELATTFGVDPSNITYRVRHLEKRNLVERLDCPTDGRGVFARITGDGLALLDKAAPLHFEGVRHHFLDYIEPHQLHTIAEVFSKLRKAQHGEQAN